MGSTSPTTSKRPSWHEISYRFTGHQECLAAYLALEGAEVLEGVKPANLINVINKHRSCGRNLYDLWHLYGKETVSRSGIAVMELADHGDSVLLLIFSPSAIRDLLQRPNVIALLKKAGYKDTSEMEVVLDGLKNRISAGINYCFPHEIGIFLGYPLKDVAAFMGLVRIPFSCQGPWKIFGSARESLLLAESFHCCRVRMAERLKGCNSAFTCLFGTGPAFSGDFIENESHILAISDVTPAIGLQHL